MGKPVRWTLKTLCGIFGYEAFRRVNDKELSTLFGMLCPFDTGIPLVRIGANSDGGYLIPDDFDGVQACLSPGVAETASFEIALEKRGIPSLLADASVSGPPLGAEHMRFEKKFVGLQNTALFTTIDEWVSRHAVTRNGDLILQMDIEGGEWAVLPNISSQLLSRFRIIVCEFHQLESLSNPFAFKIIKEIFERLNTQFVVAHSHPNNAGGFARVGRFKVPRVLEITFLRRDRIKRLAPRSNFPHPNDFDNAPSLPTFILPEYFYRFPQ